MTGTGSSAEHLGGTEAAAVPVPVRPPRPSLLRQRVERLRSFRQPTVAEMEERELLESVLKKKETHEQ
jgi:hypothetical protein